MRYLIFDDKQSAVDADTQIFAEMSIDHQGDGGKVDGQGLIGKDKNGVDRAAKTHTVRWDDPQERLDGKWVLLHPENYLMTKRQGKQGLVAKMLKNLNSVPVAEASDDWFDDLAEISTTAKGKGKSRAKNI